MLLVFPRHLPRYLACRDRLKVFKLYTPDLCFCFLLRFWLWLRLRLRLCTFFFLLFFLELFFFAYFLEERLVFVFDRLGDGDQEFEEEDSSDVESSLSSVLLRARLEEFDSEGLWLELDA